MYPLIRLSDSIYIPTYLLIISLTYSLGVFWLMVRCRKKDLDSSVGLDLGLALMVGGFVGARLFHVLYENPTHYWYHPWDIFKVWQGGFVFFGGAMGAFGLMYFVLKRRQEPFGPWADLFAPIGALGYAIGRLACFFNGCCYGKVCDLPWAIKFPHLSGPHSPLLARHPTQLYAFFWELCVFALLMEIERRQKKRLSPSIWTQPGSLFYLWIFLHGWGRLIMEVYRADFRGHELLGLSISSWISLILIGVGGYKLYRQGQRTH